MSLLRTKIAQMLLMGFPGTSVTSSDDVARWVREDGIGGVILFDKDLSRPDSSKNLVDCTQIKTLNADLHTLASQHPNALPLLIALDYEGGAVDRLSTIPDCPPTLKPVEMAKLDPVQRDAKFLEMAQTLKTLGFNLNFAPVVDLAFDVEEGIIGQRGRSFSSDPKIVSEVACSFVKIFNDLGVSTCYKHFPGHGSARGDTHLGFVDVTDTFRLSELEPYRQLEVGMIMTAHVVNRHLDPTGLPATLSKPILTDLLRGELGFDGVIISDDLQMFAIAKHYSLSEALTLTINAGADMLIFGNQWGSHDASELIDQIAYLAQQGTISEHRIDEAYSRISRLKSIHH